MAGVGGQAALLNEQSGVDLQMVEPARYEIDARDSPLRERVGAREVGKGKPDFPLDERPTLRGDAGHQAETRRAVGRQKGLFRVNSLRKGGRVLKRPRTVSLGCSEREPARAESGEDKSWSQPRLSKSRSTRGLFFIALDATLLCPPRRRNRRTGPPIPSASFIFG